MPKFILKGNFLDIKNPEQEPQIANLVYGDVLYAGDNLGKLVVEIINKEFKGTSVAYTDSEMEEIEKTGIIKYSNTPRALKINHLLIKQTKGKVSVLSLEMAIKFWRIIPELILTYADTNAVAIYPNLIEEIPYALRNNPSLEYNEILKQQVLKIIGKNKINVPILISGLDVKRADNAYGFKFVKTEYTKAEKAPFLKKDGNIIYTKKGLVHSDEGIRLCTPDSQLGIRRVYCGRDYGVNANVDDLAGANSNGRVQIFYNPKGKLEDFLS